MTLRRTLFANGRILTGEALLSPDPRHVEALLVEDDVIVAAGSTQALQAIGNAALVDLEGAFCMPGFNDAHLHLGEGARLRREVDLRGTRSLGEALERIGTRLHTLQAEALHAEKDIWLSGGGWDETLWPEKRLPTRHDLDRVTGAIPAVFARIDVHVSVANTAALERAGVNRSTVAPEGSSIDREPGCEPTGLLREAAARALVERLLPTETQAGREQSLRAVLAAASAHGVTSVQDNSIDADVAALRALHARGELPVRISEWLPFDAPLEELRARQHDSPNDRFLRPGMLKAFLDGSLGSRTAALLSPYSDAPSALGIALYRQETLNAMARERVEAGFALGFHAIGDRAFAMALAAFEHAAPAGQVPPFRIEHAQVATEDAAARMRAVGAMASIQPCHWLSDAGWALDRLGPERGTHGYAWRTFADAGIPLALGTDFPVEPMDPFRNLYAAIVPPQPERDADFPARQLTLRQALHAYTAGSALAEGAQRWKGLLAPGYVADFAVLDRDLLRLHEHGPEAEAAGVRDAVVLRTVGAGRTVYRRGAAPESA